MVLIQPKVRKGFTLMEVMVIVAIMGILASIALPNMVSYYDRKRVAAAATTLTMLEDGIAGFRTGVGRYPSQLTQLTTEITTSDNNSCGSPFSGGQVGSWRTRAPFIMYPVTADGFLVSVGVADNELVRTASPITLSINVPDVRVQDADDLEDLIEPGNNNTTTGTIRRSAPNADGLVTMQYVIEGISGC